MSEKDIEKVGQYLQEVKSKENVEDVQKLNETQPTIEDQQQLLDDNEKQLLEQIDIAEGHRHEEDHMSRASRVSKALSYGNKSELTKLSNKTYVSHLESQLKEEREARLKLERELDELKRLSSEISSHLGLQKK